MIVKLFRHWLRVRRANTGAERKYVEHEKIEAKRAKLHQMKMDAHAKGVAAREKGEDPMPYFQAAARFELEYMRPDARAVTIVKPRAWQPALEMMKLRDTGQDVEAIAEKTGYSIPTVKRALATDGVDQRVGQQCDRLEGREFPLEEALDELPLPCGPDCVCSYSPIFKWE